MINIETCLDRDGRYKTTKKHHKLFFGQIRAGNSEFIRAVLDASPEMVNVLGRDNAWYRDKSPLMYAMQCVQADLCHLLLDRGADVHFTMPAGRKTSMCSWATTVARLHGHDRDFLPILRRLLELGANPNLTDYMGRDSMHVALQTLYGRAEPHLYQLVKLLIDAGADPERKHKKTILRKVATSRLVAPEIFDIYGITKEELDAAIEEGDRGSTG